MKASRTSILRITTAALALSALVLGPQAAFASKKKKKSTSTQSSTGPLETYSAEDPDPMETSSSAITLPAGEAAGIAPREERERPAAPSAGSVRAGVPTQAAVSNRWQTAQYDRVPIEQTNGVAKRLGLVEEILRKHGRAYDYRSLTVRDLEQILAELDAQAVLSGNGR
jgi:hypothetical protein